MNKYRERYKDQWEAKLKEAVAKMIEKNLMTKKVRTFKQYDNIDKACEDVIYEHELEGIEEQCTKLKRSNLMTQYVVEVRSFTSM